jgi:hypothetical protein
VLVVLWVAVLAGDPITRGTGSLWRTVHGRNQQDTVLAMEDFTSTLQLLLVEFASLDPVLISQDVDIEIRVYQPGHRPPDTYMT